MLPSPNMQLNHVKMQYNYVNMLLIYTNRQDNFVDLLHNYFDMRVIYMTTCELLTWHVNLLILHFDPQKLSYV